MPIDGVCYGPYRMPGTKPPDEVPEAQVDSDMATIARTGFKTVRTYDIRGGNKHNVRLAAKYGLSVGCGIDVTNSSASDQSAIDLAWWQAQHAIDTYKKEAVIHLAIGNEIDRTDNRHYDPGYILGLMNYAKQKRTSSIHAKVTTCFSGTVLQEPNSKWLDVVRACEDVVYLTIYPYYGQQSAHYPKGDPGNIEPQMAWSWQNGLQQIKNLQKTIVLAESGWPSDGDNGWGASVPNEQMFSRSLAGYVNGQSPNWNVSTFWFEMFDEPWKTNEGAIGPYFGLYTSGAAPEPKFKFPP